MANIYPSGRKARSGKVLFQKDETTLTSLPAYGLIAPVTHKPEESTYNKNTPTRYHSGSKPLEVVGERTLNI